jgi:hypothetical protein
MSPSRQAQRAPGVDGDITLASERDDGYPDEEVTIVVANSLMTNGELALA